MGEDEKEIKLVSTEKPKRGRKVAAALEQFPGTPGPETLIMSTKKTRGRKVKAEVNQDDSITKPVAKSRSKKEEAKSDEKEDQSESTQTTVKPKRGRKATKKDENT